MSMRSPSPTTTPPPVRKDRQAAGRKALSDQPDPRHGIYDLFRAYPLLKPLKICSLELDRPAPSRAVVRSCPKKGRARRYRHPFSYGDPFARGCRFEMTISDYSKVDFIEIFNNPEPLHEVNERGTNLWMSLIFSGYQITATSGMDLHNRAKLAGCYATYIEGKNGRQHRFRARYRHSQRTAPGFPKALCC